VEIVYGRADRRVQVKGGGEEMDERERCVKTMMGGDIITDSSAGASIVWEGEGADFFI
jgi:hypothetical protein